MLLGAVGYWSCDVWSTDWSMVMKAIVLMRDRVTYAKQCVASLLESRLDVHIVDHNSTWPAARTWISDLNNVVFTNYSHPYDIWWKGLVSEIVGDDDYYVVTDADCVVTAPYDWVDVLSEILYNNRSYRKVGLGLRLDDIPLNYPKYDEVVKWESGLYRDQLSPNVYVCDTDTTIAMYQPLKIFPGFAARPALRTRGAYQARHLTWYETEISEEISHYKHKIVEGLTHWSSS